MINVGISDAGETSPGVDCTDLVEGLGVSLSQKYRFPFLPQGGVLRDVSWRDCVSLYSDPLTSGQSPEPDQQSFACTKINLAEVGVESEPSRTDRR